MLAEVTNIPMQNFNFISAFLKQVLDFIVSVVGNYGWSVIIFTLLIRLVLMPLDIKSRRSMMKTQALQPKIDALQKKYAKDRTKLNQKMQELYKTEGVSMFSGCLPMLLTFPIMIMMFTAMRVVANEHTVQMLLSMKEGIMPQLQQWLWIKNIFQPDSFMATVIPAVGDKLAQIQGVNGSAILTAANIQAVRDFVASPEYATIAAQFGADMAHALYKAPMLMWEIVVPQQFNGLFILPLLAAGSSFLSSKLLTPKTQAAAQPGAQPNQAQQTNQMMLYMMPLISIFICASQSAAFSVYWVFANLIQIVQQLLVTAYFNRKDAAKPEEVIEP